MNDKLTITRTTHLAADANLIATHITNALRTLHDATGGYPTRTPGAAPDTTTNTAPYDPEGNIALTSVERQAFHPDQAQRALKQLAIDIETISRLAARIASVTMRWGAPRLDGTTVAARLAAVDASIWCDNCLSHGHREVKAAKGRMCEWCAGYRATWGDLPTARILEIKAIKKLSENDIVRIRRDEGLSTLKPRKKPAPANP